MILLWVPGALVFIGLLGLLLFGLVMMLRQLAINVWKTPRKILREGGALTLVAFIMTAVIFYSAFGFERVLTYVF